MTINNAITIQPERRLCEIDGRLGYFHYWEHYATVVPSIGSLPGGHESHVFGIVEFADDVQRVDPTRIKFVDDQNRELELLEKVHKKMKEAPKNDVQREAD